MNWGSAFDEEIIKNVSDSDVLLRISIKEIECLFRNGKASPCDVNEEGETLLHVRIRVVMPLGLLLLTTSPRLRPGSNFSGCSFLLGVTAFQ